MKKRPVLVYSAPEDPLQEAYFRHAKRFADLFRERVQLLAKIDELDAAIKAERSAMTECRVFGYKAGRRLGDGR